MSDGETIRAFIALPLPEDVRERLGALRRSAPEGARVSWLAPNSIHLTLKFLGDVGPDRLERLKAAMRALSWDRGAVSFTLATVGGFPNLSRPRVLWVGVERGGDVVTELATAVDAIARRLGFPREERRFTPHLTIGRVKSPPERGWADQFAQSVRFEPTVVRSDRLILYQSRLLPSGAEHTPLLEVPLERRPAGEPHPPASTQ
jgi:RNA 2',3'-cyclic 3'-phosphodiesterase